MSRISKQPRNCVIALKGYIIQPRKVATLVRVPADRGMRSAAVACERDLISTTATLPICHINLDET